jgi:hypothetical protein
MDRFIDSLQHGCPGSAQNSAPESMNGVHPDQPRLFKTEFARRRHIMEGNAGHTTLRED